MIGYCFNPFNPFSINPITINLLITLTEGQVIHRYGPSSAHPLSLTTLIGSCFQTHSVSQLPEYKLNCKQKSKVVTC